MTQINLDMTHNEGSEQVLKDKAQPPAGRARIQCTKVEVTQTGPKSKSPGRPMLVFVGKLVNAGEFDGKEMNYYCVLPHNGNTKGIGNLVEICSAYNKPWEGSTIDTDDYVGQEADCVLEQNENGFAQIKNFIIA